MPLFRRQPERLAALNIERLAYFLDTEARGLTPPPKHRSYRLLMMGLAVSLAAHVWIAALRVAPSELVAPRKPLSVSFRQTDPGTVVGTTAPPPPTAAWAAPQKPLRAAARPQPRLTSTDNATFTVSRPDAQKSVEFESEPELNASLTPLPALVGETLIYPLEAIEQGMEGIAILEVATDLTGGITDVALADTSGHPLLDEAAVNAVRKLGRIPEWAGQHDFMPVSFRLTP